ncbi:MAG: hypothetical protein JW819_04080 [Candidatus Krumholzibacteriota bacterium]|nr:hypothetical protein [Candidatus Krumholzibacteriota bacterium]
MTLAPPRQPRVWIAVAVGLALHAALAAAPALSLCSDIAPAALLIDGTVCQTSPDGEIQTADSVEELSQFINGAAFFHAEYDFTAAAFLNCVTDLDGQPVAMMISLFNQGTSESAEGLYDDPQSGSGDPIPDWTGNGEARLRAAFGSATVQFHEACFFGQVLALSDDAAIVDRAVCLASAMAGLIDSVPARTQTWSAVKTLYR